MTYKILVADDDFDNRTIAREALELSGHRVVEATNGLEAVEMAMKERPDVILMDLSMPKLNGWEATKRIRQAPEISHIPIVAFTAHALKGDDLRAHAAGCDDYISKPCQPKDVVRKIQDWLGKSQGGIAR